MAFVADPVALTTKDPARGIELKLIGGSSDGVSYFAILGGPDRFEFSAHTEFEPDPPTLWDQAALKRVLWRVHWWGCSISGMDEASTMALIREALTVYKGVHGLPQRQSVRVEFTRGASDEVVG